MNLVVILPEDTVRVKSYFHSTFVFHWRNTTTAQHITWFWFIFWLFFFFYSKIFCKLCRLICPCFSHIIVIFLIFGRGWECCNLQQHKVGLVRKVPHPVLLLKRQSEWTFQLTNSLLYVLIFIWISTSVLALWAPYVYDSSFYLLFVQYNFVGRLLGPRGNSLKRVEASTECRVLIRGRGSIKDPTQVKQYFFFIIKKALSFCWLDVWKYTRH